MDLTAFHTQFRDETSEHVRALNDALMALESQIDEAQRRAELDRAFRAVHTIKGSARMLGFEPIARLAHALEHVLDEVRHGKRIPERSLIDLLLRGGDLIMQLTSEVPHLSAATLARLPELLHALGDTPAPTASASPPPPPTPAASSAAETPSAMPTDTTPTSRTGRQTVRVRVDRLDRLFNLAGELNIGQQWLTELERELERLQKTVERQQRALLALERTLARLRFSPSQRQLLDAHLAELRDAQTTLTDHVQHQLDRLGRHLSHQNLLV
ncbi:MAG: Hpt domain-containing protein, partial [Chloroflexus sp.]|nr:Hpt domain-containing protein [Chloroflexus sp.]